MRKKINSEAGFTLVEMLAAVVVMVLLALMVGVGIQMASNSYQTVVAKSEVELLVSTAIDAIADDLRYAREYVDGKPVKVTCASGTYETDSTGVFTYASDSYGYGTYFTVDGTPGSPQYGQITAMGKETADAIVYNSPLRVLSGGAYGLNGAYQVTSLVITPYISATNEITFKIDLTVRATANEAIEATGSVTVRCLNPPKA